MEGREVVSLGGVGHREISQGFLELTILGTCEFFKKVHSDFC